MMKLTFIGANHQVTGSQTLLEWKSGRFLLVDNGMIQGDNDYEQAPLPVSPDQVEYVLLTHAHIDHSGMLPLLVKEGFHGRIYATAETMNLCAIMLADKYGIDIKDICLKKIERNAQKYPVEKAKGKATKYNEL